MAQFGYARVSTHGQSLTAQVTELKAANCERIYQEKISGARSDRKQLTRLIAGLDKGRRSGGDSAGSLGQINTGSSQFARCCCREGRWL
jgi:DNA invertase Pin-like site-specific DNA recombinase